MSLKKQLKLKCQEQSHASSLYDKSIVGISMDHQGVFKQSSQCYIGTFKDSLFMMIAFIAGRGSFGLNNGQFDQGKMMFQAKVTERFPVGYSIETMINGKVLRGVLFSTKQSSVLATDQSLSRRVLISLSYFRFFFLSGGCMVL